MRTYRIIVPNTKADFESQGAQTFSDSNRTLYVVAQPRLIHIAVTNTHSCLPGETAVHFRTK